MDCLPPEPKKLSNGNCFDKHRNCNILNIYYIQYITILIYAKGLTSNLILKSVKSSNEFFSKQDK